MVDYTKLVIPEHRIQPKFMSWLNASLDPCQKAQDLLSSLPNQFDIDKAVGVQLDKVGEALGTPRKLPFQPNDFFNILVNGQTFQDGTGDPSVSNVRPIHGITSINVTDNNGQSQTVNLSHELFTNDYYDPVQRQGQAVNISHVFDTADNWSFESSSTNTAMFNTSLFLTGLKSESSQGTIDCTHFVHSVNGYSTDAECVFYTYSGDFLRLRINKSRLSGWSDSWTNTQKAAALSAWCAAQKTANTPVTVRCDLAAPQSITGTVLTIPRYLPVTYVYRSDGQFINSYVFDTVMNDSNYRLVLRAAVIAQHFDGTVPNLYSLFQTVLGNTGLYFIIEDNQDMTVSVIIFGNTTSLIKDELQHGLIVPRPEGVSMTINVTTNRVFSWGLDNAVFAGWGEGYWLQTR